MCGIAGLVSHGSGSVDPAVLRAMTDTMTHRGPDDHGEWVTARVAFGHRRLSIIDVHGSSQPMATPDGRFHITFNGEILNYRELRADLDYPFLTEGDTEVVLAVFACLGEQGIQRLRGQFAFAVYDSVREELWLARDRLGILPLFYLQQGGRVAFGSEIKTLVPAMASAPSIDERALGLYLRRRAVPAPHTLVRGVTKVEPAQLLRFGPDGRRASSYYWSAPPPRDVMTIGADEAVDLVETHLIAAVSESMVADVPVGAYLSGGVDSSLVVALASGHVSQPLHTFCASFGDPLMDESPFARAVAERFGTRHHEVPVSASTFQELWPRLSWHRDAPISEPADIAVFTLAKAARQYVKVVLSGEGSDELFGGYPKYRFARATTATGLLPGGVRDFFVRSSERALPRQAARARVAIRSLEGRSAAERAVSWFAPFTPREVMQLTGNSTLSESDGLEFRDPVDLLTRVDIAGWLPDNLLERGDRMSMAASLELRPPFLDARLVDLALRLPSNVKVRDGQTKWVLKQVAERHLPTSITRRRKMGFKVPLEGWFRTELKDLTRDLLLSQNAFVADLLDQDVIRQLLESHASGRRQEQIRIWTLLSLEQWARVCIRGD